ncbi:MAG: TonB-dependent receptor [Candidatus Neomarinimicrobiota bacterium]
MTRKLMVMLLILGMVPLALFSGTTGKITGTITDKQSGGPLIGVNVVIVGTTLGAATDADGYYSILNVPVGTHSVRISYIGYRDYVEQDVQVYLDLTSTINFQLERTTLDLGAEVVVTAERKMIRKDETNTNIVRRAEDIENMPVRGLAQLASTTAGVVRAENSGAMNVRGGRGGETATYIDGVLVTDPFNAAQRIYLPNQAIAEMSVQTGGFNAEYGDAMSGVMAVTTNVGGERYKMSFEAITDQFLSPEKKTLGTYSYGYNEYVGTLSGPIIPKMPHTFYVSLTRNWQADASPSWGWAENSWKLNDYSYEQPIGTGVDASGDIIWGDTVTHHYSFDARLPNNYDSRWTFSGKTKFQLSKNLDLKASYIQTDRKFSADFLGLANTIQPIMFFNTEHRPLTKTKTVSFNTTLTHMLSSRTFYDLKLNIYDTQTHTYDPVFGDNLEQYGDPAYNPWPDTSIYDGVAFTSRLGPDFFQPGGQYDAWYRQRTQYWGVDLDFTTQQGKYNTIKAGFEYKYHTLRSMRVFNPTYIADNWTSDYELLGGATFQGYGYDVEVLRDPATQALVDLNVNETNEGNYFTDVVRDSTGKPTAGMYSQAPYHPIIMSGYVQDKIEFRDLVLNMGLRYDYINPNAWQFKDIDAEFDAAGNYVDGTGMFGGNYQFDEEDTEPSEAYYYFSPRFGVSFPVTDQTIFHAQYGVFHQAPPLTNLYLSPFFMDNFALTTGYFTNLNNPNLRPAKTTSYEVGFKQMLGSDASLQLTAFYKETEDLVSLVSIVTDVTTIAFPVNGDFGTIRGLDVIFNLRRIKNLSVNLNYELQFAEGTGSATLDNYDIAWQSGTRGNYPKFSQPLDFEQRHSGSLVLDYRIPQSAKGFLRNSGVNTMFTFNSGNPYTATQIVETFPFNGRYDNDISNTPVSAVGSETTPWNFRIDMKIDKRVKVMGTQLTFYAWVVNLLNSKNVQDVYKQTGLADDTGFLGTPAGQTYWRALDETGQSLYKMREIDYNYYGQPRQFRLGVMLEL